MAPLVLDTTPLEVSLRVLRPLLLAMMTLLIAPGTMRGQEGITHVREESLFPRGDPNHRELDARLVEVHLKRATAQGARRAVPRIS